MCVIRDSVGINLRCIDGRWTINGIQLRWSRKTHCSTGQFTVVTNTSQKTQSNDCPLHSRLGTMFSYHPLIEMPTLYSHHRHTRISSVELALISILDHINSEFPGLISCNYEETNNEAKKKIRQSYQSLGQTHFDHVKFVVFFHFIAKSTTCGIIELAFHYCHSTYSHSSTINK